MKKANISSIITLLVILIIYSTIIISKNKYQKNIDLSIKELTEIRNQKNNFTRYINNLKTTQRLSFIKKTQNITDISQLTQEKYYFLEKQIILEISLNYSQTQKYNKYENTSKINITLDYPINFFLEQTKSITPNDLITCACPQINQEKCNNLFKTKLSWQEETCEIFGKKYLIHDNTSITKALPHYLFKEECQNIC